LNDRFADWYYVIPEETYAKLRVSRDDLFDTSDDSTPGPTGIPGMPRPGQGLPGMVPQFPRQ
ncbi:MAG: hypothetical protein AAFX06_34305, partial [Planctomycetota bacterium]